MEGGMKGIETRFDRLRTAPGGSRARHGISMMRQGSSPRSKRFSAF